MKIWLYYAKSGGGHRAPAEALSRDLKRLFPGTETRMVDLAEKASVFFRATIEDGYVLLAHHLPRVYAIIYLVNNNRWVVRFENFLSNIFIKPIIRAQLSADRPDAVVSTHFLVSPLCSALADLKINIPVFIMVTDPFSVSPVWFYNKNLRYILFSDTARELALKAEVPPANISVFRQIVNQPVKILLAEEKTEVKRKFNLNQNKKMILIIGGANGLPKGEKIFEEIVKNKINAETVFVSGTNERQAGNLRKISAKYGDNSKILGWVEELGKLMATADLVVTKSGAGVVWESLLLHKPLLITHHIFGQEKGTMEFVVKNGLGWYLTDPVQVVKKIRSVIEEGEGAEVSSANERMGFRSGNDEIADFVHRTVAGMNP